MRRSRWHAAFLLSMSVALLWSIAATAQPPTTPDRPPDAPKSRPPVAGLSLPVRFDSEVVRLVVVPDSLQIEGLYRFTCAQTRPSPISLFYPYPADSLMGGARTLRLEGRAPGETWEALEFREGPSGHGVRWVLPLCSSDTFEVRTVYRQGRRTTHAIYIVSTTRAWGRPLRHARFEVVLPAGAREPRFSFPFELRAPRTPNERAMYVYEATDFLPDHEITVDWKEDGARQVP